MAIYHCSVKIIGRSTGRSAIACAAYRSGSRLYSEETDRTFDYGRKGGVVFSEIALCANAPERFLSRQTLWNEVQAIENKSDSRLAREIELALPLECNLDQWIEIGREYASYMTSQGMIADWSIHNPINKETGIAQNPHIHMMVTTRPIKPNGEWGAKEKKVYRLDDNGERIPVIDPETGEQKIGARGRKMWQRETVDATGWDRKEKVLEWRETWEQVVNRHLEPENHIDHRSNEARGIEELPTVHEGYKVRELDKELMANKGIHADRVQENIDIKEYNRLLPFLKVLGEKVLEKARALYERVSEHARNRSVYRPFGRKLPPVTEGELGTEGIKRALELREREVASVFEAARTRLAKVTAPKKPTGLQTELSKVRDNWIAEAKTHDEELSKKPLYEEQKKIIPAKCRVAGSIGSNFSDLYDGLAKALVKKDRYKHMRKIKPTGKSVEYDGSYVAEVFIIKPSYRKKAEKILENIEHVSLPFTRGDLSGVALVCDDRQSDYLERSLKYDLKFHLYLDYSPEKEVIVKKPREFTADEQQAVFTPTERMSVKERLARAKEKAAELEEQKERELQEPQYDYDDFDDPDFDDYDSPGGSLGGDAR